MDQLTTVFINSMWFSHTPGFAVILLSLDGDIVGSVTCIPSLGYESYGPVNK